MSVMKADLHTHSEISDGTDRPAELIAKAEAAGLSHVALTDHDTFAGLDEAMRAGERLGIQVIPGVEISTELGGNSVHLLGYVSQLERPGLLAEFGKLQRSRSQRIPKMLLALDRLGLPVSAEEIARQVGDSPSVGRPHVADAMIALGYVKDRREAFDHYLAEAGPAYVPRYYAPLGAAIDLIHAAGGVAVLAHPWGRESRSYLTADRITQLVGEHALDGIEADHHDHDSATRAELRALAADLGILATGSSDYHGLGKLDHDLGSNTTAPEVVEAILDRLRT
jgi:predicted metal-dependent phosphoesterase TrpH